MTTIKCWIGLLYVFSTLFIAGESLAYSNEEQLAYLVADTGYRWDKISNRASLSGVGFGARVSTETANKLNTFLLGAKGQLDICEWLIKGSAHYGWINSGRYDEGGFLGNADGHTIDASGGLGYYFNPCDCWGFAPFAGWSYDEIDVEGKHVRTPLNGSPIDIGTIKYRSKFQGPWIGIDFLFFEDFCYQISFGYELHHAHWRAARKLPGPDLGLDFGTTTGFSNVRTHNNIWGNVFHLEGIYSLNECWDIGLSFKYQIWKSAGSGRYRRTSTPLDPAITHAVIQDVSWESFTATANIGYVF